MAATKTTTKTTTAKRTAPAPAPQATAPAPQAPVFTYQPYSASTNTGWPPKAAAGNSIRAYCANVAQALVKQHKEGFTVAQFASALAANAKGTSYKQPSTGWGTAEKPNGAAMQHANWFANPKQSWLVPVS